MKDNNILNLSRGGEKIAHEGDTESFDQCYKNHNCNEKKRKNLNGDLIGLQIGNFSAKFASLNMQARNML